MCMLILTSWKLDLHLLLQLHRNFDHVYCCKLLPVLLACLQNKLCVAVDEVAGGVCKSNLYMDEVVMKCR